jgi:hypothetical protein
MYGSFKLERGSCFSPACALRPGAGLLPCCVVRAGAWTPVGPRVRTHSDTLDSLRLACETPSTVPGCGEAGGRRRASFQRSKPRASRRFSFVSLSFHNYRTTYASSSHLNVPASWPFAGCIYTQFGQAPREECCPPLSALRTSGARASPNSPSWIRGVD